jgi:uncharacterized membrane-anchored protein YitT (DUF2179 family)
MQKTFKNDTVDWNKVVLAMRDIRIPNRLMYGGIAGCSILLHEIFHINITFLAIILVNLFIYLGYTRIGKTLVVPSSSAAMRLAIGLLYIDITPITHDKVQSIKEAAGGILKHKAHANLGASALLSVEFAER